MRNWHGNERLILMTREHGVERRRASKPIEWVSIRKRESQYASGPGIPTIAPIVFTAPHAMRRTYTYNVHDIN